MNGANEMELSEEETLSSSGFNVEEERQTQLRTKIAEKEKECQEKVFSQKGELYNHSGKIQQNAHMTYNGGRRSPAACATVVC
jgi:hypothetical protein